MLSPILNFISYANFQHVCTHLCVCIHTKLQGSYFGAGMSTRNPISDGVACSKIAQYQSNVHTAAGYTSASSIYTPKGSFTYDSESQTKANH